jgi:heme-degrading monooxygenase HmoA
MPTDSPFAATPQPPYYAVIFTTRRTGTDPEGYETMAREMKALASRQPGFLGMESAHENLGITVSYWSSLAAIGDWKRNVRHQTTQALGRAVWYAGFRLRICRVERETVFDAF